MCPKLSGMSQRYVFAIMGFIATLIGYMMRISLDLVYSHMVIQNITADPELYDPYSCPDLNLPTNQSDTIENIEQKPFDWDSSTQVWVSSAFRFGYIMTQFLGGMLADRSGGKQVLGISLLVLSVCTLSIPCASKLMGSTALYILRLISGLVSGPIIPALLSMMSKWVPIDEQALIGSIIFPGSLIGYVAGSYLSELLLFTVGWEAVYYTFGLLGIFWCLLWKKLVYSTPNEHPSISEKEKCFLNQNLPSLARTAKYDLDPLPFKAYIRCGALWGTVLGYVGREWAFATLTIYVPQFMKEVLRFDITVSSFFVYMPYVCMWVAALTFGFICDIIVKKRYCSVKNARKIFTAIAAVGASLSITVIMYSGCSPVLTMFWMFMGMIATGAYYSGCMIGALNLVPNYAGSIIGAIDNIAISSVVLMPEINALIITDALLRQWRLSFWIVIILLGISIAVYTYYVHAEQVWWDDVRTNGYPEHWKHGLVGCEGVIDENGESVYKARKDVQIDETKTIELRSV